MYVPGASFPAPVRLRGASHLALIAAPYGCGVKWQILASSVVAAALVVLALLAFNPGGDDIDPAAAQQAARNWTGFETTDPARREGNGWEVDVRREDGSVVEVNLGPDLELIELDEELGPGGTPAYDEVQGPKRARAIAVAHAHGVRGDVRSVEQERDGSIEVDVVQDGKTVLEVDLDSRLNVRRVDEEEFDDE